MNDTCNPLVDDSELGNGGIPFVLAINVAVGGVLLMAFLLLYVCFKEFAMLSVVRKQRKNLLSDDTDDDVDDDDNDNSTLRRRRGSSMNATKDICESVIKFITLSEKGVQSRIGTQGSIFLTLELYFLAILSVYLLFSLVVVLPVNMSGKLQRDVPFASTTLANLDPSSSSVWTHVVFSVLYFVIACMFFLHFILKHEDIKQCTHTTMIRRIPPLVHIEDLHLHFEEATSGSQVIDIKFAYNTRELHKKWKEMKKIAEKKEMADVYEAEHGAPLLVYPGHCFCLGDERVEAKEYYTDKLNQLRPRVSMERNNALHSKLSIGFITFSKEEAAEELVDMYRMCRRGPQSSLSDSINSRNWSVSIAPPPTDIIWDNLSVSGFVWWLKWICINAVLFVFLIFFTTPSVLLNSVTQIQLLVQKIGGNIHKDLVLKPPDFLMSYWSSFLLILFGVLLLALVTKSVYLESHWSRTQRESVVLRKAYVFKLLQVVILPSIGLTSLSAVGKVIQSQGGSGINDLFRCIFLPNNGAFFISYIIIAAFVSTPIELLRIPQLVEYAYYRVGAKTRVEKKRILKQVSKYNFSLGVQYAYNLLIFSLTVTFSLSVPLIVPFGVVFFIFKYFVDKYNLLYGYRPLPSDNNVHIHKTTVKVALIGVALLQLITLFYSIVRTGRFNDVAITMLVCLLLSSLIMCGVFVYGWFSYLLPSLREKLGYKRYQTEDCHYQPPQPGSYVAPVMEESTGQTPVNSSHIQPQSYESFGRTIAGGEVKITVNPSHV